MQRGEPRHPHAEREQEQRRCGSGEAQQLAAHLREILGDGEFAFAEVDPAAGRLRAHGEAEGESALGCTGRQRDRLDGEIELGAQPLRGAGERCQRAHQHQLSRCGSLAGPQRNLQVAREQRKQPRASGLVALRCPPLSDSGGDDGAGHGRPAALEQRQLGAVGPRLEQRSGGRLGPEDVAQV